MKKLSLVILVVLFTTGAFSQNNVLAITTVKKIETDEVITSLKVYKNADVILTDNQLNEIQVVGEKTDVENTSVKISNGEMIVTGSEDLIRERVTVYVPSRFLDRVSIHGSSNVSSEGLLKNEILDIIINGQGKSSIKSIGMISLNTIGDFALEDSSM
jgi:putative autotransporter adhesin-like protein